MLPTIGKAAFDKAALVLDYDGVLAPLASTPTAVAPDVACAELLAQLCERLEGRLALLSGRTIADLHRLTFGAVMGLVLTARRPERQAARQRSGRALRGSTATV